MPNQKKKKKNEVMEVWTQLKEKIKNSKTNQVIQTFTAPQPVPVSQKEYLKEKSWKELEQEKNRYEKWFNLRNKEVREKNEKLKQVRELVEAGKGEALKGLVREGEIW